MQCEFDCEGCGVHVVAFGIAKPPAHGLCATCAFLCEYFDPLNAEEWEAAYKRLNEQRPQQRAR